MDEPTPRVAEATMETVTSADGTEIAVHRTGSGPPLVLVYGNGDVHQFWDGGGVRPRLAEHYAVHAVERRGRDGSGDAPGYDLEREAEDVAAVVEAVDGPVTLLGHSGGALYSLEAAARTDGIRRLVLYEPPIQVGDNELDVAAELAEMASLVARGEHERAFVSFARDVAGLPPDELDALRSSPFWAAMVDAVPVLPRELAAISEYEFEPARFADLDAPTLLLTGGESPPLYRDATNAVDDALPNSRIATFEGEGHMAMHTAPDRFVDEVHAFVRESS